MTNPELDQAKEPLKRFIMRNRNLTNDEKIEAYGMLLDCVIGVIKATNATNLEMVRERFCK